MGWEQDMNTRRDDGLWLPLQSAAPSVSGQAHTQGSSLGRWSAVLSADIPFAYTSSLIWLRYPTLLVFFQESESSAVMRGLPCLSLLECDRIPSPGWSLINQPDWSCSSRQPARHAPGMGTPTEDGAAFGG